MKSYSLCILFLLAVYGYSSWNIHEPSPIIRNVVIKHTHSFRDPYVNAPMEPRSPIVKSHSFYPQKSYRDNSESRHKYTTRHTSSSEHHHHTQISGSGYHAHVSSHSYLNKPLCICHSTGSSDQIGSHSYKQHKHKKYIQNIDDSSHSDYAYYSPSYRHTYKEELKTKKTYLKHSMYDLQHKQYKASEDIKNYTKKIEQLTEKKNFHKSMISKRKSFLMYLRRKLRDLNSKLREITIAIAKIQSKGMGNPYIELKSYSAHHKSPSPYENEKYEISSFSSDNNKYV
ncbi:hypothetical protein NEFER03_0520 [Nematocida sp. LUAm3]|nr:hypothetical protein NEFER03_0520 [Nematocida sp. LUAm3]KAI5175487.1 hypothetical protein NEFER02_1393 [Nematocida sp. LUAm2]KAI5178483.1 hypothetical protein NEFER01_1630 [Nematocida sp. LUAm1]